MTTTRNQDLQACITQIKESLNQVTSEIDSTNSRIEKLEIQAQKKIDALVVNHLLNRPQGPSFSDQTFHLDGADSSHSMLFQSNSFHCDPHLSQVEVNKFDGSDPTGWVTQMEHYFSLHVITDELDKLRYVFLYLDPEH
jgi:hypothetical protein